MTRLQVVRLVAAREVRERVRSKAFLLSTAISLVVVLALAVVPAVLGDDGTETYDVGVLGRPELAARLPEVAAGLGPDVEVDVRPLADRDEARRLVADGELDAAVVDAVVVVDEELGDRLGSVLQEASRQVAAEAVLVAAGSSASEAAAALSPPPLGVEALDPPDEDQDAREGLVFVGTILLYGQLLGFGFYVASGVVDEKASRVVELLLAKVSASTLLTGKILGIGGLGFLQLVGFVVVGLSAASLSGAVELPPETLRVAVEVVAWFVLGFALYSCLFAVAGAMASRPEEMQATTMPLSLVAVASFFAAVTAGGSPDGIVARIATFVPPAAPLVMPIRSAAGAIAAWELVLGVGLVLVSIVLVVRVAARAYGGAALHTRGQLSLRQVLAGGR